MSPIEGRPARRKPPRPPPDVRPSVRRFGGVLLGMSGLLGGGLLWLGHSAAAWALGGIGGAVAALSIAAPGLAAPLYRAWMSVARLLGGINTKILLTLVYYLVVTPMGLLFRVLGRDALRLRKRNEASCWLERSKPRDRGSYFDPY